MIRRLLFALTAGLVLVGLIVLGPKVELAEVKPIAVEPAKVAAVEPTITVDGGRVIQIWPRGSLGHGCPVSPTEAYTADHVAVYHATEDPTQGKAVPLMWGDRYGNAGTLIWMWSDIRRDLSFVTVLDGQFSGWFKISDTLPKVGDMVVIVGYDYEAGLVDTPKRVKVLQVLGGNMTYDGTPGPGSSGSCVLSEAGEIVGINVAMVNGQGIGVLMAAGWANVPDQFKQGGK